MTYEAIYIRYFKRIQKYIQFKLNDEADPVEDLCQEVFLLLFLKWDALDSHDEDRIVSWLYNAALIKVREYCRKKKQKPTALCFDDLKQYERNDPADEILYESPDVTEEKFQAYLRRVKDALSTDLDRQTFEWIVEKKCSIHETALKMNTTDLNIRVRWHRIRKKIQSILPSIFEEL